MFLTDASEVQTDVMQNVTWNALKIQFLNGMKPNEMEAVQKNAKKENLNLAVAHIQSCLNQQNSCEYFSDHLNISK